MTEKTLTNTKKRIPLLDVLRGVALVAMAIYHFGWDLSFFGYVSSASVNDGPWKIFARCIASSFLLLVGFSLVLAHQDGIIWRGFWKRWFKVAAAALVITIATFYFTPDAFIFFGILHQIAFASLAGLLFLRIPALALLILGTAIIFFAPYLKTELLDGVHMSWTGLQAEFVRSNDYVPVFPWFGAVLIGMAASKFALSSGFLARLPQKDRLSGSRVGGVLGFLGRHSLLTYLVHQPVLIALIYGYSLVFPAQIDEAALRSDFATSCQMACEINNTVAACAYFCGCVEAGLDEAGLFTPVATGAIGFNTGKPAEISQQCSIEMFDVPQDQEQEQKPQP
ncbi:MAG: heparan-alpha-glucosaminide N-acetyltransferase [Ahrensia sp.]|nr:heparan-alpha-glucosaminide N-acetyltransferase [Ahrensia sp.]